MRVLILGEGVTDYGRTRTQSSSGEGGVLPALVQKLLNAAAPGMPVDFTIGQRPRGFHKRGFDQQLLAQLALPKGREADAIVMVVDRDGEKNKDRITALMKGRDRLQGERKRCAVGVAIEMIEAWLLADEKALARTLGNPAIQRQPDPETLQSRDEHSDNNPKGRLTRIMESAFGGKVLASDFPEHYGQIADAADIAVLEDRCPKGFAPFAAQVRDLTKE